MCMIVDYTRRNILFVFSLRQMQCQIFRLMDSVVKESYARMDINTFLKLHIFPFPRIWLHGICIFELLATVNKAGFCQPHQLSPTSQKYVGRFKRLTSYFYKFQINKTYIHGTVEKNKCI